MVFILYANVWRPVWLSGRKSARSILVWNGIKRWYQFDPLWVVVPATTSVKSTDCHYHHYLLETFNIWLLSECSMNVWLRGDGEEAQPFLAHCHSFHTISADRGLYCQFQPYMGKKRQFWFAINSPASFVILNGDNYGEKNCHVLNWVIYWN